MSVYNEYINSLEGPRGIYLLKDKKGNSRKEWVHAMNTQILLKGRVEYTY